MGCTSSAQNMPDIPNATETTGQSNESNDADVKKDNEVPQETTKNDKNAVDGNKIDALPTCDSIGEIIQLARNSNSFTKDDHGRQDNGEQYINSIVDENNIESTDQQEQNKFSTLKEVADQVLLNNILEDIDQSSIVSQESSTTKEDRNVIENIEEKSPMSQEDSNEEQLENIDEQGSPEETASPSQSDGNRSTRWEALADIAAELPPSLAVDPITGQIYSLTK